MNQIISIIKQKNRKKIIYFYLCLIISIIVLLILLVYYMNEYSENSKFYKLNQQIKINLNLNNMYNQYQTKFFGNLIIDKINIEYPIYSKYTEENLKMSICKFSGNNLGENGNITIIGHNYKDNRFFGNLNELQKNDKILIESGNKKYNYKIVKKYLVDYRDFSCLEPITPKNKELTLITCDNIAKKKRLVIKAIISQTE